MLFEHICMYRVLFWNQIIVLCSLEYCVLLTLFVNFCMLLVTWYQSTRVDNPPLSSSKTHNQYVTE